MATAYLFPGQGSERAGMGRAFNTNSLIFKETIAAADAVLPFSLPDYLFGAAPLVDHPDWLQPALVAYQVALFRMTTPTPQPADVVMGLSLGEYSALIAAGMLTLSAGLKLVAARGTAMRAAAAQNPGGMLALRAPDPAVLAAVLAVPEVWLANRNSPKQVILGGREAGLAQAQAILAAHGQRAMRLPVAGAFHTPLMAPAAPALQAAFALTPVRAARLQTLSTTTFAPFAPSTVAATLVAQMATPTDFARAVTQVAPGVTRFVEVAETPVLTKLVRQSVPAATTQLAGAVKEV
ncbi:ACP S-malonyltransferase [Lacticaseibacillus daqingensis]|uniref:ACP S-malonyltransferase n=1 Tax=Lacticaseibacillus daqingensis TaxID=2486014 RepID=UPI000F79DA61|nr:ACP S-malonyltransferase [Lacticaseibacillus daqingensis]